VTPRQKFLAARLAFVAVVLLATLTNLQVSSDLADAAERLDRAFNPSLGWKDAIDGLRNLVLFAGLGGVWVATSLSGRVRREIWPATLVGLVLSTTVEGVQAFSPVRDASILDVTTNTLGALGGALVMAFLLTNVRDAKGKKSYVGVPTILIAGPYALAVLCEALAPLFHSAPLPQLQGGPLSRLTLALNMAVPLDWREAFVTDVPLYAAAGFLLVALINERWRNSTGRWLIVAVGAPIAVIAAHVIHGAFGLPVRWEAAVTDAIATAIGAWVARHGLGPLTQRFRGAARARAVIFAYAALLVLWGWRPLLPETNGETIAAELNSSAFVPLASLAARFDIFSAIHVAQQFFLYLPIGALLAVWPLRRSGKWAHLWPALWFAVVIELGHIVVAERTFDTTNALLDWAGLALGWLIVRRCGYQPYGAALGAVA
jgi:glycopeptide antibiotics resistance protein